MNKKLFAFDMDGTLMNKNDGIHPNNIKALKEAKAKGHILMLASGRPYSDMHRPFKEGAGDLHLFDYMVCNNGTYFYDIKKDELIFETFVSKEIIKDVIKVGSENNTFFALHADGTAFRFALGDASIKDLDDAQEFIKHSLMPISKIEKKLDGKIAQASLRGTKKVIANLAKYFEKYSDEVSITIANEIYLDINPKGVSKLTGLKTASAKFGMSIEDVVAFGDSGNDVKMLHGVGIGVAMGNGTPEAKEAADFVIEDNNTDAIGRKIMEIINA